MSRSDEHIRHYPANVKDNSLQYIIISDSVNPKNVGGYIYVRYIKDMSTRRLKNKK